MEHSDPARHAFEQAITHATRALNGQLPRPWMTDLADPRAAQVFIVGRNPARSYDAGAVTQARHLDALFNRNGQSCRRLYDELAGKPSPTRRNVDFQRSVLSRVGVERVLETNVICYASPMSADLSRPEHKGGRGAGKAIFKYLLDAIHPRVVIVHGARTADDLGKLFGTVLPAPRAEPGTPASAEVGGTTVLVLPSLAPPAWNGWQSWADAHLEEAAALTAAALAREA